MVLDQFKFKKFNYISKTDIKINFRPNVKTKGKARKSGFIPK